MSNSKYKNNTQSNKSGIKQGYSKSYNKKKVYEDLPKNYYLIPVCFIICILPLIVRLKEYNTHLSQFNWGSANDTYYDVFLYYKQWIFVFIAGIMAIIIIYKNIKNQQSIRFTPVFIPLAVYAVLVFLSAALSKYSSFSFSGSFEQFESVFAVLGYCIVAYYTFLHTDSEHDLKVITKLIIAASIIMSIIGISQFTGHDIISSKFGLDIILPAQDKGSTFELNMGKNTVFLTLFNPNYVGVYVALLLPIIVLLTLFMKDIKLILLSVISIIGLIICIVGSHSATGILSIIIVLPISLIFMWRYLLKRYYVSIPIIILLVISIFIVNNLTHKVVETKIESMFKNTASTYPITEMNTNDDSVSLVYNGNKLYVKCVKRDDQTASLITYDENYQQVANTYDPNSNTVKLTDERFIGVTLGAGVSTGSFSITVAGRSWIFTNQTEDGTYYYLNSAGKLDKMINAPSALFTGHELFASSRGYIWSRTIPLVKKYIFLGSGPDTFTMAFPQNDYLNYINAGFKGSILTKPHCQYLQIAVQTGLLSLIAFLLFYGMYFISSVRLYIRGRFNSYYAKVGVAIFVGTISYMLAGLTNDSSITTAPVFWVIIGVGIAANYKAKPLIKQEIAENKVRLMELKKSKKIQKGETAAI